MRPLFKIFAGLLVLVIVAFGVVFYQLNTLVREAVLQVGPEITGTTVDLDTVDIAVFDGSASIAGLAIGNPDGFQQPNIFSLESVQVEIDLPTVLEDVVVINRIFIQSPEIFYEGNNSHDNFRALLDNIAANLPASGEEQEATASSKKIIIDDFVLVGGMVTARHDVLGDRVLDLPLPELRLTDIGRNSSGVTAEEAARQIIQQITRSVSTTLAESAFMAEARERLEALREDAETRVNEARSEAEERVKNELEEAELGEEQQEALRGLLNRFGN